MATYSYKVLTLDRTEKWLSPTRKLVDSINVAGRMVIHDYEDFTQFKDWFNGCRNLGFKLIPVNYDQPDKALTIDDIRFFTKYAIFNPEFRDLFIVG